jgi:hypothetical protein
VSERPLRTDPPATSERREPELAVIGSDGAALQQPPAYRSDDDLTLPGLLRALGRGFWLIVACALVALLVGIVTLKATDPEYTATMVVAPAGIDLGAASRLATSLEQYANLASLAQTPVKLEQVAPIERYVELLTSVRLARRLAEDHGMLQRVFAGGWDEGTGTWKPPSGPTKLITWDLPMFFGYPGWSPPDARTLARFLEDAIEVDRIEGGALREVMLDDPDPKLAADLLAMAHDTANGLLHAETLAGIERQIQSIEATLERSDDPRERAALETILAEQNEARARIAATSAIGAEYVSAPEPSARPTSPHPLLILALFVAGGVALGVFVVVLRELLSMARTRQG